MFSSIKVTVLDTTTRFLQPQMRDMEDNLIAIENDISLLPLNDPTLSRKAARCADILQQINGKLSTCFATSTKPKQ